MKTRLFFLAFIALININLYSNPFVDDTATVKITKVFDGDTYGFNYKNEFFKIRLLGADTYETSINDRLEKQAEKMGIKVKTALSRGLKAKSFAEKILLNKKVKIVRDKNEKNQDIYNRLLRYVLIDDVSFNTLMKQNKIYYIEYNY
jgi:micrococcal nuclease